MQNAVISKEKEAIELGNLILKVDLEKLKLELEHAKDLKIKVYDGTHLENEWSNKIEC